LEYLGITIPLINTIFGLLGLYILIHSNKKTWTITGFLIGIFWFWWIALSFRDYGFTWAIPIGVVIIALIYAFIFWLLAYISQLLSKKIDIPQSFINIIMIFAISYIHPFGFDWLKLEIIFVDSYIGVTPLDFILVLISLSLIKYNRYYILISLFAINPNLSIVSFQDKNIDLITTNISIKDKWNIDLMDKNIEDTFKIIQNSIDNNFSIIILPESIIPKFINKNEYIKDRLKEYSNHISIVIGGLYLDDNGTPRNSTYIFTKDNIEIANKVVLVPFGEVNPLPKFLSDIVNRIFYDGAIDYKASKNVYDYTIDNIKYRNAICFEATSERLYENSPKYMIAISNLNWFTPSIQPTLQKLLLKYYHRKYGTIIYHSINGSRSYIVW